MELAIRMYRKWVSVCISALSALAMHFTFAIIVQLCFSASVFPIIIMIVGTLFLWMICGGWCRRWLGLSPSAPTFVFFNVFFLWGVYIFLIRKDVGPAMDAAFNTQCLVLAVGLWRMLLSDPGYVRYENTFAESIDQTIFSETKTDQLGTVDHFSATIGNDETASDNRLFVRARYCRKCKAYVDRFDHHCPAIGNCVGQRNHRLFILLLVTFVSAEMCYFLCSISCFPNFINFWKRETQASHLAPWIISTTLFAIIQVFWQVPFLFWHLYCIIVNVTTDEWVNWEKYPEFQQEVPPELGRPFPGRKFKNPYNKGILLNIIGFLKSKP